LTGHLKVKKRGKNTVYSQILKDLKIHNNI
jgi:hypothetical protein